MNEIYVWNMVEWFWQGNIEVLVETTVWILILFYTNQIKFVNSLNVTLSITNLTWTDLGSNMFLRDEKPKTKVLSHGTALVTSDNL